MIYDVILSKEDSKYIARVKEWPEVIVEESTRDEAIQQVTARLLEYLTKQVEVVQIEVPLSTKTENPWLEKFGWFKDDPTFDDLQNEIAAYRKEIDSVMKENEE
jgi:predicted RNase H-like HicB family nuclease